MARRDAHGYAGEMARVKTPMPELLILRKRGWKVDELARACCVSKRQVYRWIAGDSNPHPVFQFAIRSLERKLPPG